MIAYALILGLFFCGSTKCEQPQPRLAKKPLLVNQHGMPLQRDATSNGNKKQKQLLLAPDKSTDYLRNKRMLEQDFARDLPDPDNAKKKYKKEKIKIPRVKSTPFWSSVTLSDMNYDQLLQRKNELIITGDYITAIKYLERMFKLTETPEQIVYIMLEWGELLMKVEDYKRAETLFRDFVKLYPGNEYAASAFVKAIECSWQQTSIPERDQTKTEDTLTLVNEFNSRKTVYGHQYSERVAEIEYMCLDKLTKSSLGVAKQYIGLSKYRAAHKRLDNIRGNDLEKMPTIEPMLLQLEIELAQAEQQETILQQKLADLKDKYPTHEITLALSDPKKSWLSII